MNLTQFIRSIPDFPRPGILFRDITPLMGDPAAFRCAVDRLAERFAGDRIEKVCAAEARGFLFASALGYKCGWGVVPVRKPGKLPWETDSASYALEYGEAVLHMHTDAVRPGERVLIIDDLLATGGTARAMRDLVERQGGNAVAAGFVVELADLNGRNALGDIRVESLLQY